MGLSFNLLEEPLIHAKPCGMLTLPGLLAALTRDEVETYPALRPHQGMFWHMFLVQLAALALNRAGQSELPETEEEWAGLLRGLTPDFPDDQPWCLIVDDWSKPAFMQPPVPEGMVLGNEISTPDALDLLITSKNHDLKQTIAFEGQAEDWVFALISLQTGEGYGGAGNQGISRMNGGFSSRPMLTLAPLPMVRSKEEREKYMAPRPGAWWLRDVRILIETRDKVLKETALDYSGNGLGLTWLAPWLEGAQLQIENLDIWFIEVCRRVRLMEDSGRISAQKGTSKATRINAKELKGTVCDPWAPVHKTENKNFTLGEEGDFNYRTLIDLLLSGNWEKPLLAEPAPFETPQDPVTIAAMALARGNSKTGGFRSRFVPISGKCASALGPRRAELHKLAQAQADAIANFDKALAYALVMTIAGGERAKISRDMYVYTQDARAHLDHFADSIFFEHLWKSFEAEEAGGEAKKATDIEFTRRLWKRTKAIFEQFVPAMPCPSLYRHRAEARAWRALRSKALRDNYPEIFEKEERHAA